MAYPAGYKYTKDHEWIELTGERGKVGITDYAQQQLGDVVYVELPEVGAKLKQGQSFGTIESVKAVSELYAPVSANATNEMSAADQRFASTERISAGQEIAKITATAPATAAHTSEVGRSVPLCHP